ncbi:putative zinc finger protein 840 isoform X2 [Acropora millepora]|uniref:putative zinc finger protein 840 isoform X2 n=1 Tax=Acropora millepora TaxID=45264 RepID=UPI001CF1A90F|nr:putative zinc finger protein 840 isoform X2 [Acropora millepora]
MYKMADQVEQVHEASIESVASNLSNNPAALNAKPDKSRSITKPTGWNSFLKAVAPGVQCELGPEANIGKVSSVASRMWKSLPRDRRMDWKQKAQSYREDLDTGLLNKMQCPTCRKSFTGDKDCKQHMKGCKTCVCEVCNKTFDHESKLKRHTNKMHLSTYKCETCNKVFAERRNLARHQRTHK